MNSSVILTNGRVERCSRPGNCRRHGAGQVRPPSSFEAFLTATDETAAAPMTGLPARGTVRDFGLYGQALLNHAASAAEVEDQLTPAEEGALTNYMMTGYLNTNAYLREGKIGLQKAISRNYFTTQPKPEVLTQHVAETLPRVRQTIAHLDTAIAKSPAVAQPRVLYRALRVQEADGRDTTSPATMKAYVAEHYPVGGTVTDAAYLSCSADSDYMLSQCRRRPSQVMVLEILTDTGLPTYEAETDNIQALEREVLLPRNMRFQVVGTHTATYKYSGHQPTITHLNGGMLETRRFTIVQLRAI